MLMNEFSRRVLRPDAGQTTVEYALAAVFVIGLAIAAFAVLQGPVMSFIALAVDRLTAVTL